MAVSSKQSCQLVFLSKAWVQESTKCTIITGNPLYLPPDPWLSLNIGSGIRAVCPLHVEEVCYQQQMALTYGTYETAQKSPVKRSRSICSLW